MEKVAVVLFNLGGPDSKESIKPFLFNFFMDPNIISLPVILRYPIAKLISIRRSKREAGDSYGEIGGRSPLLENSLEQARALDKTLQNAGQQTAFKSFICMRYWHPMADEVVQQIKDWGADRVILLPLYPQFSTTTSWSSLGEWESACVKVGFDKPTSMVCCYPKNDGFVQAAAKLVKAEYDKAVKDGHESPRVLFSAHGLPESVIKGGDPYQWQCEETAAAIARAMGIEDLDWTICYQSRVGPQKWIGPSLDEEIRHAALDGKAVVIFPHAFTQEHVETLVELDIEYKELADHLNLPGYYRAGTVSTHPDFITGLKNLVLGHLDKIGIHSGSGICLCPDHFGRCCMKAKR